MPVYISIEKVLYSTIIRQTSNLFQSQIATLSVTRLSGPAKNDKLVAAYCPMIDGIKDAKEVNQISHVYISMIYRIIQAIAKHEAKGKKCQIIRIVLKVVNAEDLAVPDPSREAVS